MQHVRNTLFSDVQLISGWLEPACFGGGFRFCLSLSFFFRPSSFCLGGFFGFLRFCFGYFNGGFNDFAADYGADNLCRH